MNLKRSFVLRLPFSLRRHLNLTSTLRTHSGSVRLPLIAGVEAPVPRPVGAWKAEVIRRLLPLQEGAFVDCGVNLGQTLMELRSVSDRPYVGFEPNSECVYYVRRLVNANGWKDCTLVCAGLGDAAGVATLYQGPGESTDPAGTILGGSRPLWNGQATLTVAILPLDDAWHAMAHHISLIKVDVEGAEAAALRGMRGILDRERPPVLCEVLPGAGGADLSIAEMRHAEIRNVLASTGYVILHLIRRKDGALGEVQGKESFLLEHFDRSRTHLYDYVLAPKEKADTILRALS